MSDKKIYDLIFSIGEACSCTSALRNAKLQYYSYPFDWLYGCAFEERIKLLTTNFEHFLDYEDLEYSEIFSKNELYDVYQNKRNGLVYNHDFPARVSLKESYSDVKEKYTRRINRLLNHISLSKKVLIVLINNPNKTKIMEENSLFESAIKDLKIKFKEAQFDILFLTNDSTLPIGIIVEENNYPNVTHLTLNYKSLNENDEPFIVNCDVLKAVFSEYKISNLFKPRLSIRDFIEVKKLKRGFGIYTLKNIFNIIRLKFLFFGLRFDFCIGQVRD